MVEGNYSMSKIEHDKIRDDLNKMREKKNFISYAIPRMIDNSEEEAAREWWISHECFNNVENWDTVVDLRTYYPNIYLIPQSIGISIFVKCPFCGETKNVTSFENW